MKNILITLFFGSVFLVASSAVHAATLQFDPSTASAAVGETVDIIVKADAGSDEILAVDAIIKYDKSILEVVSIADGDFLSILQKNYSVAGTISMTSIVQDPGHPVTGSGELATVTFKVKADGTTNITFFCTPGDSTDSNIAKNNADATDIIQCADNGTAVITAGEGGPTAVPTGISTSTGGTDTPTTLPRTGIMDELYKFAIPGSVLLLIGIIGKLLI